MTAHQDLKLGYVDLPFVPNDRSQYLYCVLSIMRCAFGSHLDLGLAERSTPYRFDGLCMFSFPGSIDWCCFYYFIRNSLHCSSFSGSSMYSREDDILWEEGTALSVGENEKNDWGMGEREKQRDRDKERGRGKKKKKVCVCMYTCACARVRVCVYVCMCMRLGMRACMCVCAHACACSFARVYWCVYVHISMSAVYAVWIRSDESHLSRHLYNLISSSTNLALCHIAAHWFQAREGGIQKLLLIGTRQEPS